MTTVEQKTVGGSAGGAGSRRGAAERSRDGPRAALRGRAGARPRRHGRRLLVPRRRDGRSDRPEAPALARQGREPPRGELVVLPGGARRLAPGPPGHRPRARLRPARRRKPVLRHGRLARPERPRMDAHRAARVGRHLADDRPGPRRASKPRPRARRHPRRPQARERDARPRVERPRPPRLRPRPRAGVAPRVPARLPRRRRARAASRRPLWARGPWVGSRPSRSGGKRPSSDPRPISTRSAACSIAS